MKLKKDIAGETLESKSVPPSEDHLVCPKTTGNPANLIVILQTHGLEQGALIRGQSSA
jgi:hypothetical protein